MLKSRENGSDSGITCGLGGVCDSDELRSKKGLQFAAVSVNKTRRLQSDIFNILEPSKIS